MNYKIGDTVRWSSQAQGYRKEKVGVVVAVLAPMDRPNPSEFPSLYKGSGCGFGRRYKSYVVKVGNKYYWPIASILQLVEPHEMPA